MNRGVLASEEVRVAEGPREAISAGRVHQPGFYDVFCN